MKRVKRPSRRAARRNPLAKAVREGIYRKPRVVARQDLYKRRPKHKKGPDPSEEGW
jgi:hypothetical protein